MPDIGHERQFLAGGFAAQCLEVIEQAIANRTSSIGVRNQTPFACTMREDHTLENRLLRTRLTTHVFPISAPAENSGQGFIAAPVEIVPGVVTVPNLFRNGSNPLRL